jgi:hypothetical protein
MAKQTVFVPNTIASWQSRLLHDKANGYGTKHGCFMTMQIDAQQSKRLVHQTRLLHDKGVLLRDKANGYDTKHDCFVTKQEARLL